MDKKPIIVPTPVPAQFDLSMVGLNKNAVVGNAISQLPKPAQAVANIINTPTQAQLIINEFLQSVPQKHETVEIPAVTAPASPVNTMPTLPGAALNGSPMFSNLQIQGQTWEDFNNRKRGFRDLQFDTVLMMVAQQKNIIVTEIQGSDDGAVLEYSGLNNYDISIDIIVTKNQNGIYPTSEVEEVIKMLECPYPIRANSWYLQMFNINDIVITNYTNPQEPGGISQQVINIQARSSKKPVLIIQ